MLAWIPTFLLAGHERTPTGALAAHARARGNAAVDQDALAALDRLPLLDVVVR
jgi:hypothetical protein